MTKRYGRLPCGDDACRRLRRKGMRLPVPPRDLRPDLRAGHARHAVLHRVPEARGPALRGGRRGRDRPGEGRGAAGLRRRRDADRARGRARARSSSPPRARSAGSGARTPAPRTSRAPSWSSPATNDTDVNIAVYDDAERRAMLVNVVDVPPLCNFILPAIVRTGPLAIAISTAGASPALAKRMKREVAELFGEEYAELAVMLNDVARLGQGHAAHLPGPQGVLRGDRQRRSRPDRAAARRRRAGRARPHRGRAQRRSRRPDGRAHPPRRRGHRADGRRRRQGGHRAARRGARGRAHDARDRGRPSRPATRPRATCSAPRASPASRRPSAPAS